MTFQENQTVKPNGRPTVFSNKLADEICDAIACTAMGLTKLCKHNALWPEPRTIYRWLKDNNTFSQQYARAKKHQIDALIDEILEIADDSTNDYQFSPEGKIAANHEHIQRSKLRIDTRKWLASKLVPKIYGDKSDLEQAEDNNLKDEMKSLRAELDIKYKKEY